MNHTPIDSDLIKVKIAESKLKNVGSSSIREILALINSIEKESGVKFIRMEMGVPGLPASPTGINAEIKALNEGVASVYPSIEGIPELKNELSRFIKLFLDTDVSPQCCLPVTGSTGGSFISFLIVGKLDKTKDTVLFLDPGFPVHKLQLNSLGYKQRSIDVYNYRGIKLADEIESAFKDGNISSILYSNPNNPTWICFSENELKLIGNLCNKYNVIAIEDLAYLNMDFRKDYSEPGEPPYQPTIGRHTDKYILLISSSKIFSFAGERVGGVGLSEKLFNLESESLVPYFNSSNFGHAFIYGAAYAVSAGVNHSSQYALAAMLKSVNDDETDFTSALKVYGELSKKMKKIFTENGFEIVYNMDEDGPLADGFYFTVSYPGLNGEQLIEELLYYGISAISLMNTGSRQKDAIRACVSLIKNEDLPELERRLNLFNLNHSKKIEEKVSAPADREMT